MSAKKFEDTFQVNGYKIIITGQDEGFGAWATGKVIVCSNGGELDGLTFLFECKHFEEGCVFGIDNGRISKLFIEMAQREDAQNCFSRCLLNYDRGWDITVEDTKKRLDAAYAAILKKFN